MQHFQSNIVFHENARKAFCSTFCFCCAPLCALTDIRPIRWPLLSSFLPLTQRVAPRCYRALGRCDDTMNLGGIKVSSVELERVCNKVPLVAETAAVAVNPASGHGPSMLVVFVVAGSHDELLAAHGGTVASAAAALQKEMQNSIKKYLNPLFGIAHTVIVAALPRTASNKIMRRVLRDQFTKDRAAAAEAKAAAEAAAAQ